MFRFSLRDGILFMMIAAILAAWVHDHRNQKNLQKAADQKSRIWEFRAVRSRDFLRNEGYYLEWSDEAPAYSKVKFPSKAERVNIAREWDAIP
jgi:hypothetical protein